MIHTGIQLRKLLMARPLHLAPWQAAQRLQYVLCHYVPVIKLLFRTEGPVVRLFKRLDPRHELMEGFLNDPS